MGNFGDTLITIKEKIKEKERKGGEKMKSHHIWLDRRQVTKGTSHNSIFHDTLFDYRVALPSACVSKSAGVSS